MKEHQNKCLRILVVCDNFLIGGRETYLKCYIEALKNRLDITVGLLTGRIEGDNNKNLFDYIYQVENNGNNNTLSHWLKSGHNAILDIKADIIWVHHYCLLPAWLLSAQHNLPLLSTFHGSLFNQGKLTNQNDQLGLACAIEYGGNISTVSYEISDEIYKISNTKVAKKDIAVLNNAVFIPKDVSPRAERNNNFLSILVFSRQQKLGHLRAAVMLFAKLNSVFSKSKMTIYTGQFLQKGRDLSLHKSLLTLLGRKWVLKNFMVIRSFNNIEIRPLSEDVKELMADGDIVFGMGRVALEGIASNRPTVLIGYEKPIALITADNFKSLQYSNFSGRNHIQQSSKRIIDDLATQIRSGINSSIALSEKVDVESHVTNLLNVINGLTTPSDKNIPANIKAHVNSIFSKINDSDIDLIQGELDWLKKATPKYRFDIPEKYV